MSTESNSKPIQTLWDTFNHKGMSLCIEQYYYSSREFEMALVLAREYLDSQL